MSQLERRPTVLATFVWATLAVGFAAAGAGYAIFEASRRTIVARSERSRDADARSIGARVAEQLDVASAALVDVEAALRFGALRGDDQDQVEARLFSELLVHSTIADLTLTHARLVGHDPGGEATTMDGDRWQIAVFRSSADPNSAIFTRRITQHGGGFEAALRRRPVGGTLASSPFEPAGAASDPTQHPTFRTPVQRSIYGRPIWSDLSWSELDAAVPTTDRRVVVTLQKAVEDEAGRFAGVVRVGLLTRQIDELPRTKTSGSQHVFLSDGDGRLVARLDPTDPLELQGDDLRVVPNRVPSYIAAALASPALRSLSVDLAEKSDSFVADGVRYLATFRVLPASQAWVVGILVPESSYTADLLSLRNVFLAISSLLTASVLVVGALLLGRLRASLQRVVSATNRMRSFDFAPAAVDTPLRETAEVMAGLERAKTSMRALAKYVPVDLVRELYEANREPALGGELVDLSIMFSDIQGFTTLAERLTPAELARALGLYLSAVLEGVRATSGTVDKFIGDSVMAFWNAPTRHAEHSARACRAVLACKKATAALYTSANWASLPPLITRFGIHRATVMVGHFGAPDRFSYTALGDGVNLASRLEGLCKLYGVTALASEAVATSTGDAFAFRLIDKVAVKGKTAAVRVYELLGMRTDPPHPYAFSYERALEAYFSRDFRGAIALLDAATTDGPSRAMAARCKEFLTHPPPVDWDGAFVAVSK